jgi:hypothetical protein
VRTEASIERSVVDFARKHGWVCIKLSTSGPRGAAGWPDRLFLGPRRRVIFVEFKRPGGKVTALQASRHAQLGEVGWTVQVMDNVEEAKAYIEGWNTLLPADCKEDLWDMTRDVKVRRG